jgi:hypothetical protein
MKVTRKDAPIENTGADEDFPGTFEVILSAPTEDRDGDTLLPEDWETPLPEHITFDRDHAMSVAGTVGSGVPRIDEETGNLVVSGTYSSLQHAQDVRTLVKEGHIRTTSVAFMSKKVAKAKGEGDGYKVVRELLNGAFVAIPSNREALVLSSKSGARNSQKDAATIQALHDGAVNLGASCEPADDGEKVLGHRPGMKAIAGSVEAGQERIRHALAEAYPGQWAWIRGTLPDGDGGGTIIFELEDETTMESATFQQTFSDDGETVTLQGDAQGVTLQEVVTAGGGKPDGEPAGNDAAEPGTPGAEKSAPGAGDAAAQAETDREEMEALEMRARALAYGALHRLER